MFGNHCRVEYAFHMYHGSLDLIHFGKCGTEFYVFASLMDLLENRVHVLISPDLTFVGYKTGI